MILLFPDVETVRLALSGTLVPAEITLAPAAVSTDPQGRVYLEPKAAVPRPVAKTLDRLGVKGSKRHGSDEVREVGSWVEVLPLTKAAGPPAVGSQTPVLFELESAADLPAVVTEMLRLGNDRQGFRTLTELEAGGERVLLRVHGPPYYTLLRALDPAGGGVRAYLERAPRVWVQAGYDHPLAAKVKVSDGQLVLVRPPADWVFLDDAPFQDVYDVLRLELPARPALLEEAGPPDKLAVPLSLAAGNAADVPEFWVLRGDAVARLDTLVRDADDRLVERLTFAVAAAGEGERTVVLRTRPSKLVPPALPLDDAAGYKPYWKLPNLFLPTGKRLRPTLRRDAVRNLLTPDPDQVVWLDPGEGGRFTPRSLPDAAFRPLGNWVDYVIEADQAPLAAWIGATAFDFDHFECKDAGGPKPPADKPEPVGKERGEARGKADKVVPAKKPTAKSAAPARVVAEPEEVTAAPARPRDEWAERRALLERKFLDVDGPLDDPARRTLWPELATANAGVGEPAEAALCWLNALWSEADPPAAWLAAWARAERPGGALTVAELDARLARRTDGITEARGTVALFLALAGQRPKPPDGLTARLPAVQAYLDAHQSGLPVRAVWLVAARLAALTGSDVLGLARARDRLLLRLLQEGLSPERDLPRFLRVAGARDAERMRAVLGEAQKLHAVIRAWCDPAPVNKPFVDLYFAYALARLGEANPARKLLDDAKAAMVRPVPETWNDDKQADALKVALSSNLLYRGFRVRVDDALAGRPAGGPLPADLQAELAAIRDRRNKPKGGGDGKAAAPSDPYWQVDYVISRCREESEVLDPEEKREAYAVVHASTSDALGKEIHGLGAIKEPARLAERVRRLYRDGFAGHPLPEVRYKLLHEALPLAPRAGEAFALELVDRVASVLPPEYTPPDTPDETKRQGRILERALVVAANYGRSDLVPKLVEQFTRLLRTKGERTRFTLINVVAGRTLRALRKFGLRDEIDGLLTRIRAEVLGGSDIAAVRAKYAGRKPEEWAGVLQSLLTLAAGWLTFGLDDRAAPILKAARDDLLGADRSKFPAKDFVAVARAYIAALGQGRADALPKVAELFTKMDPAAVLDPWTGHAVYSRHRLGLVEEVVLALASDDHALGPTARRWLDDDEFLVRRRIHADLDALRRQAAH